MENWYEIEGSVEISRNRVAISQKDWRPLREICKALDEGLGIRRCRVTQIPTGYYLWLPIEEGAKFVRYVRSRVKTEKAFRGLEELEKSVLGPAKCVQKQRKRAREALLFG